jgi:acyl carrier protein phosphodiesterase
MNFLSHLVLAGDDEGLMLGALLGDFVRGKQALQSFQPDVRLGIELHRHIDQFVDSLPDVAELRTHFEKPFRRYAGIIIDVVYDHELAVRWSQYSDVPLETFDQNVRQLLARNEQIVPSGLRRFMHYADRRGLFATYRKESEILLSLSGVSTRLSRPNPLNRVDEIWADIKPLFSASFESVFFQVQSGVDDWLRSRSTISGS